MTKTWTSVHKHVADVIDRHEPHPSGAGCCCGWGDPKVTWADHVAQVLANLGLLATTEPEETP